MYYEQSVLNTKHTHYHAENKTVLENKLALFLLGLSFIADCNRILYIEQYEETI